MQEESKVFYTFTKEELEDLLIRSATIAVKMAGNTRTEYTRAEMRRMHGRGTIDRLIKEGRLTPKRVDGSQKIVYSETQYQSLII